MQYCVDHPEEISKLAKVKAQVSEVKGVMMENIEKVDKQNLCYLCNIYLLVIVFAFRYCVVALNTCIIMALLMNNQNLI